MLKKLKLSQSINWSKLPSLRTTDTFLVVASLPPRKRSDDQKCVCCSQATSYPNQLNSSNPDATFLNSLICNPMSWRSWLMLVGCHKSRSLTISFLLSHQHINYGIQGLLRCKNLWTFSLFRTFSFPRFCCVNLFVFFCFMSPMSLTGSYTEDELQFELNEKVKFFG